MKVGVADIKTDSDLHLSWDLQITVWPELILPGLHFRD